MCGSVRTYSVPLALCLLALGACSAHAETSAFKIEAPAPSPGDWFGWSVALQNDTAVVGAHRTNARAGVIHVYSRLGNMWLHSEELAPTTIASGDEFGNSVALDGNVMVVGAYGRDNSSGAIYLFARDSQGGTWTEDALVTNPKGPAGDRFGQSVSVSGNRLAVGAGWYQQNTGAVYLYAKSGETWVLETALDSADVPQGARFGTTVALDGNTVAVGAPLENRGAPASGAVYVFAQSAGSWVVQQVLSNPEPVELDRFGVSISLSGDSLIVGTSNDNTDLGRAYVYVREGDGWHVQAELDPAPLSTASGYGSVAIDSNTAVVGAIGDDEGGNDAGAALVYYREGGEWFQHAKLIATDASSGDLFGGRVAVHGDTALVGAWNKSNFTGAAYLFELGLITSPDTHKLPLVGKNGLAILVLTILLVGCYALLARRQRREIPPKQSP